MYREGIFRAATPLAQIACQSMRRAAMPLKPADREQN
jgi:hypothetical protein